MRFLIFDIRFCKALGASGPNLVEAEAKTGTISKVLEMSRDRGRDGVSD